jgi:hypothetical protein
MKKSLPPLQPSQFVREINEFLPDKQGFTPGLRVFLTPRGCSDDEATGWDWTTDTPEAAVAVVQAFEDVRHLHGF